MAGRSGRLFRRARRHPDADGAAAWLAAGERVGRRYARRLAGSPEAVGWEARERYAAGDVAAALFLFSASIDELHTAYCVDGMERRVPGPGDAWIVDAFSPALEAAFGEHARAPLDDIVVEVVQRLRAIATACGVVGVPPALYLDAATAIEACLRGRAPSQRRV